MTLASEVLKFMPIGRRKLVMKKIALLSLLASSVLCLLAIGQGLRLISNVDPSLGSPAGAGGDSWAPILSPDGRYVLFASTADNLLVATNGNPIPLQIPAAINVFRRDRTNGTTTLVSVNVSGVAGGNGNSWPVGLSTNGQFALFESSASDLVPGDTNGASDVFVRDLVHGTTLLVSVSTNGTVGNGASRTAMMTPDGRYVAFVSGANNLVGGDNNGIPDIFVRDLQSQTTTLVSAGAVSTNASAPSGSSEAPDMTPDGRYIAFFSTATNLVPGVPPGGDVYVRDVVGGTTIWASTYARTAVPSNSVFSFNHAISADGQYVAYEASAALTTFGTVLRYKTGSGVTDVIHTNAAVPTGSYDDARSLDLSPDGRYVAFVANTNGTVGSTTCVELWDGWTDSLILASADPTGQVQTNSVCDWPVVSPSGQFVAFLSTATNLTPNALQGDYHVYLRNVSAGTTSLLDADTNSIGSPVSAATIPRFTPDFRLIAFECADAGPVPNDRNRDYDVFLRDLTAGTTELISVHDPALPSLTPNGPSSLATTSISSNGLYVAFASEADNLVPNDTNNCRDIFVRDLLNGTNILVSVATNGYSGDGVSSDPAISSDGRYVAFSSRADNLVPGDTNKAIDVFVRDLQLGTTTLVSVNTNGIGSGNSDSYTAAVSAGGRFVLFRSKATNLVPGQLAPSSENLFVRDLQSAATYALTTNWDAISPAGDLVAVMSPSGRVAYGNAPGLGNTYLYVWDPQAAGRIYTNTCAVLYGIAIDPTGNHIAFAEKTTGGSYMLVAADLAAVTNWVVESNSSSLYYQHLRLSSDASVLVGVKGGVNPPPNTIQVYAFDLTTGNSILVSHAYGSSSAGLGVSDSPDVSADGRFIAFRSAATNIVQADANGIPDVFLYDRLTGTTTLLSPNQYGVTSGGNRSLQPVFSGDSASVFFQSWAPDLVAQDFNQSSDIIEYKLYSGGTVPVFQLAADPTQPSRMTWPVIQGKSYRVQFKNSLADPVWQDLSSGVTVLGNQGSFQDPSPNAGQRYYRVVAF